MASWRKRAGGSQNSAKSGLPGQDGSTWQPQLLQITGVEAGVEQETTGETKGTSEASLVLLGFKSAAGCLLNLLGGLDACSKLCLIVLALVS